MLRTIIWYTLGWLYLFITFPVLSRVRYLEKRNRLEERDRLANRFSMFLAKGLFFLTGSSITVTGLENIPEDQSVLFVSNHQSHMDSAVIHGFIRKPKGFIADKEVKNIPILRTWMKYMKCIFIDRKNARRNIRGMEESVKLLKSGHSMVIYPEGRIYEDGKLGEFRKGSVKLAIKARVPIVPITIVYSTQIMSRSGSKIKSAKVRCIISEPVQVLPYKDYDEKELTNKVRDIIVKNLN